MNKCNYNLEGLSNDLEELSNTKNMYSTDKTYIGTWIDGKPLYRKVMCNLAFKNGTTTQHPHLIENVDHIHIAEKYIGSGVFQHPEVKTISVDKTNVNIECGNWYSNMTVILHYTKTTD